MKKRQLFDHVGLILMVGISTALCAAQARHLRGTIIAYDPAYHTLKQSSFVKNREVVIAETRPEGKKKSFVKLVFESFGPTQVNQDVLEGLKAYDVRVVRDTSCDEAHPRLVNKFDLNQGSGIFLINSSHVIGPLPQIENLLCFRVIQAK
jgi:hypothetical protein